MPAPQAVLDLVERFARNRVNVFDWEAEFSEIFKAGGSQIPLNPPLQKGGMPEEA
jgi:hypothetical protein